ncbi:MAG TPA: alpha/beta hydrolase [Thermoanaerobaculia bacterium]
MRGDADRAANGCGRHVPARWVEIRGGNHSQFGHYGHQLLDGHATIARDAQQAITRAAIFDALAAP